ncbi:MAG TPA: outer membrane beta-barrel protein [Candidatus Dormibacteraeota bacterium]|nr:outer membrane beta-barrel protein [Candidatus Dormibacteraeota bacterium]
MNRGIWTCMISLAILVSLAATALAETAGGGGPYRERRERTYSRNGFEGRTYLRFHGGISFPSGDFSNAVNSGLGLGASLGYGIGRNTVLSGGVAYHRFGEDLQDGHVSIVPVAANIDYGFSSSGRVRPWISGGLGLYNLSETVLVSPTVEATDSESDFGFNLGFGIAMPTSGRSAWGVGLKYHHISGDRFPDTNFLALQAGLSYPL